MSMMTETAMAFFNACESGKGWHVCSQYCHADAIFNVQAKSLEHFKTIKDYSESIPHLMTILPDAHYELRNVATDTEQQTVLAFARFLGTHTGIDEPVPATGKAISADYVFVMRLSDGKIAEVTKVWNDSYSSEQLGWS